MDRSNSPQAPADMVYESPAASPVEGHPIGNGRMGTMVWTTPGTLELQINRVDVFAINKHHRGPREGPADHCGACARISVHAGGEVFEGGPGFVQRLSLQGAEELVAGDGVHIRCFVSAVQDVAGPRGGGRPGGAAAMAGGLVHVARAGGRYRSARGAVRLP